jgi:thiamine kinase
MTHPRLGEVGSLVRGGAALAPFRGADAASWRVIPGGAVNLRVAVETRHGALVRRWFLRLAGAAGSQLGAALSREAAAHGLAAAAGLAPPLVDVDIHQRTLVTAWVEGRAWTWRRARTPQALRQFATLASALHALPVPAGLGYTVPATAARALLEGDAAAQAPNAARLVRAALAAADAREPAGSATPRRVLAHFDAHAGNLLEDATGRLWLVDFEYAAAGVPVDDLAGFATAHDLAPDARRRLLEAYAAAHGPGAGTPGAAELELACVRADALWLAWTVAVHGAAWQAVPRARRVATRLARAGVGPAPAVS